MVKNLTKSDTNPRPVLNHNLPALLLSSQDKDWQWMEAEKSFFQWIKVTISNSTGTQGIFPSTDET